VGGSKHASLFGCLTGLYEDMLYEIKIL